MTKQYNQLNTLRSYRLSPIQAHGIDDSARALGISSSLFVRQAITEAIARLQNNKPLNTIQGGH